MIPKTERNTVNFRRITPEDQKAYETLLFSEPRRGCEFTFANLYLWGRQQIAFTEQGALLFSQFNRRTVYPYPLGENKKELLDAIIEDAAARGIPCRITGLSEDNIRTVEALYPNRFRFHCDEGSFDYVYAIDDLADLKGKNYQKKRNHLRRFEESYPGYEIRPITKAILPQVREMLSDWYTERLEADPHADLHMEKAALERAFSHFDELSLDGIVLLHENKLLAFTLGSRLARDTFDVQFEKACSDIQGAYAAINREFARYIREKYPEIRFLDREEDMGLEGLRKAKKSYYPHHMIEKCWACLLEDGYDY